jgi:hypothetical protein
MVRAASCWSSLLTSRTWAGRLGVHRRAQTNQAALIKFNKPASRPIQINNDEYQHDDQ